jgi:hypothetical protein
MKSREWFVLGIRLFGIWQITQAVGFLSTYVNMRLRLYEMSSQIDPNSYLLNSAFDFALAAGFLFGARKLAAWCDEGQEEPAKERKETELA